MLHAADGRGKKAATLIPDCLDYMTGEHMGHILAARGIPMTGFWASKEELMEAWSEAMSPPTLLTRPSADERADELV